MDIIVTKSRCRDTLFIMHHKCIKDRCLGYRCKYCGKSIMSIRKKEIEKKMK